MDPWGEVLVHRARAIAIWLVTAVAAVLAMILYAVDETGAGSMVALGVFSAILVAFGWHVGRPREPAHHGRREGESSGRLGVEQERHERRPER